MSKQDRYAAIALIITGVLVGITALPRFFHHGGYHDQQRIQKVVRYDARWGKGGVFHWTVDVRAPVRRATQPVGQQRVAGSRSAVGHKRAAHSQKGLHRSVATQRHRRTPRQAHAAPLKRSVWLRVHRHQTVKWARTRTTRHMHGGLKTRAASTAHTKVKVKHLKHYLRTR